MFQLPYKMIVSKNINTSQQNVKNKSKIIPEIINIIRIIFMVTLISSYINNTITYSFIIITITTIKVIIITSL